MSSAVPAAVVTKACVSPPRSGRRREGSMAGPANCESVHPCDCEHQMKQEGREQSGSFFKTESDRRLSGPVTRPLQHWAQIRLQDEFPNLLFHQKLLVGQIEHSRSVFGRQHLPFIRVAKLSLMKLGANR